MCLQQSLKSRQSDYAITPLPLLFAQNQAQPELGGGSGGGGAGVKGPIGSEYTKINLVN